MANAINGQTTTKAVVEGFNSLKKDLLSFVGLIEVTRFSRVVNLAFM